MILFDKVAIIGIGLIGSSLALGMAEKRLAGSIVAGDANPDHCNMAVDLGIVDEAHTHLHEAVVDADLVIIATPLGAYGQIAASIMPHLKSGAILTDVGSVKQQAIAHIAPHLRLGIHFIPGHPIAGTEHSGPKAGFAELFNNRWCILTPLPDTDQDALGRLKTLWKQLGSNVASMDAKHHDQVLAITSHLPHLIAYTIVGTAAELETSLQQEVIQYSASGFRDFTRIAASDPVMWRDIFLNNKEAVLEMLGRFNEDLTALQKAIRWDDAAALEDWFTRTRAVRRGIVAAQQDV